MIKKKPDYYIKSCHINFSDNIILEIIQKLLSKSLITTISQISLHFILEIGNEVKKYTSFK